MKKIPRLCHTNLSADGGLSKVSPGEVKNSPQGREVIFKAYLCLSVAKFAWQPCFGEKSGGIAVIWPVLHKNFSRLMVVPLN